MHLTSKLLESTKVRLNGRDMGRSRELGAEVRNQEKIQIMISRSDALLLFLLP